MVNVPRSTAASPAPQPTPPPVATIAPNATPDQHQHELSERAGLSAPTSGVSARAEHSGGGRRLGATAPPPPPSRTERLGRSADSFRSNQVASALTPPSSTWSPAFKFGFYPNRKLRADDKDPATIWASLPSNDPAHDEIELYLMSDLGPPTPEPIKIPKGGVLGEAKLVANRPGDVQVWYAYSDPPANVPEPPLKIQFISPVWAPKVVPSPRTVTLLDSNEIGVQLVDYHGTSVLADEDRSVYLSVESGAGELANTEVKFAANTGRATTKFTPILPGLVKLVATSPNLPQQSAEITVTVPYLLLVLCLIGGAVGGLLAYWTQSPQSAHRVWIGLITGFFLYWALAFGIVHWQSISHGLVVNPISAIALPLLGGWGGTKVITVVLKALGLGWAPASP